MATHVAMRDGVKLATDVYLSPDEKPRPCLLIRTPYGRRFQTAEVYAHPAWYVSKGFAVVCQDTRGRGASEGEFLPFEREAEDGYDTIGWIAAQPWCNGAVGTYGFSYPGAVQLAAATLNPKHLVAIAPAMTAADIGSGWTYRNGVLNLSWILTWVAEFGRETAIKAGDLGAANAFSELLAAPSRLLGALPVGSAFGSELSRYIPYLAEWLRSAPTSDYWRGRSSRDRLSNVAVPGLWIAGWYDVFLEATLAAYQQVTEVGASPQRLVVGPWWHTPWGRYVGEEDFGPAAGNLVDELQVRFFSHCLGGEQSAPAGEAAVRLFVMGENDWYSFERWPPQSSGTQTFHLHSDGHANSLNGNGRLEPSAPDSGAHADWLASDPAFPVSPAGGRSCCYPEISPMGPADQRGHEIRNDVLVYDSDPLPTDLLVIGNPILHLWVGADRPSVDLVVRLVDVRPDGRAVNVSDANLRLDLEPGDPLIPVRLTMSPTAVRFQMGHRIRLDIMETCFPMFERNAHGSCAPIDATLTDLMPVTMTVAHNATFTSRLELPLVADPPAE